MNQSTVHLFIFDTMSDWEYGYLAAGINNPRFQKNPGKYRIRTVAVSEEPVTTMGGLRITPDQSIARLTPKDSAMLVLPGGTAWDQRKNSEAADLAAQFLAEQLPVAGICGATFGLASRGLLDAVPHTSNSKEYVAASGYKGSNFFREAPAVTSGNLITASAMSPLEFAKEVFAMLDIYSEQTLAAWYSLYKTGDAKYYLTLMKAQ
jgi:putative intracellular protease/amidase